MNALSPAWLLLKDTVTGFIDDEALSRGAAIAYYTLFSIAPVLLVVVAIAGLAFGHDAAEGAIVDQLSAMMGHQTAVALQGMIESAAKPREGTLATIIGVVVLIIATSGVFGEVQSAMNAIWKIEPPPHSTLTRLMRARLASLGLVVTCGFLLTVSLAASAALAALSTYLTRLPRRAGGDQRLRRRHVGRPDRRACSRPCTRCCPTRKSTGATLPSARWQPPSCSRVASCDRLYIGQSNVASSYGAAGALIMLLVWIYYSSQIFLLGAEFSRAYAKRYGSHANP